MSATALRATLHVCSNPCGHRRAGFYHAVDWSEMWFRGLLAFHVFVWVFAIATRKSNDAQMVLLLSICARGPPAPP